MISMHFLLPILAMLVVFGVGWLFVRWYLK